MAHDAKDGFVKVASLDEVQGAGCRVVHLKGHAIALFHHEGRVFAVDNRCPHMGFPLNQGTVKDGVLTCHWHHARFELSGGDTFDPWADDVQTFPVDVRDGDVWLNPEPARKESPAAHWTGRLRQGLEDNLRLVVAKAVIGLDAAGVAPGDAVREGVLFGTRYRERGWASGLTMLTAAANVLPELAPEDRRRALFTGLRHVARDAAGEAPKFPEPPLEVDARTVDAARLEKWFREAVEVRDDDGAERVLQTAIRHAAPEDVARVLYAAATDHLYLDGGHSLDFAGKALEALDHIAFTHADAVLPSVVHGLTQGRRMEESSAWRRPVDVARLLFDAYDALPDLVKEGGSGAWAPPDDFTGTLLSDDPHAIVRALTDAVRAGATAEALARAVTFAAAVRVAQFGTTNEFSDWDTVHHTFTYANAVHQATRRARGVALYRGAFDAAMSTYLNRFLNTPPTRVPKSREVDRAPDALLDDLFAAFDKEGHVDDAGRAVADYLDAGGDEARLKRALGHALYREDAGFHDVQILEASFRQCALRDAPAERRVILIALARWMAAHFPTRRENEQTYRIAERLHHGEKIWEG